MNRKPREKENNNNKEDNDNIKYIEPIAPKFNANWAQGLRLDRIIMNVSGKLVEMQIVLTTWCQKQQNN